MSRTFDSGVSRYIKGSCTLTVGFPVDLKGRANICCVRCPMYRVSSSVGRCAITSEILPYPQSYVGAMCPLEMEEDANGSIDEDTAGA